MTETLSIEKLPPSDVARSGEVTAAANSQMDSARHFDWGKSGASGVLYSDLQFNFFGQIAPGVSEPLGLTVNASTGSFGFVNAYSNPSNRTFFQYMNAFPHANIAEGLNYSNTNNPAPTFRSRISGPVRVLLALFERWEIDDGIAAVLLGASTASFITDLRNGTTTLNSRDMQDRAKLIVAIYEGVHSLLQQKNDERQWINSSLQELNNHSVLELMQRGSISDFLFVQSFVDHANGR
jgi:hypothetical protein